MPAANTTSPTNPFEAARQSLIDRLTALSAPSAFAIGEVSDHIREAANIFDQWLYAVGSQVADSTFADVDLRQFQGAFLGAVDGNATYEAECVAAVAGRRNSLRRA